MQVNDIFPSKYLKASDLKGQQVRVTIDRVEMESVGQGQDASRKPVIYFARKEKGLVANKTNMNAIAASYGDETDDWLGQDIVLFETMADYQGRSTPAIRCRVPPRKPAPKARLEINSKEVKNNPVPLMDDEEEIPF